MLEDSAEESVIHEIAARRIVKKVLSKKKKHLNADTIFLKVSSYRHVDQRLSVTQIPATYSESLPIATLKLKDLQTRYEKLISSEKTTITIINSQVREVFIKLSQIPI